MCSIFVLPRCPYVYHVILNLHFTVQNLITLLSCLPAKFDIGLGIGRDFFFEVPQTISAAEELGWTRAERLANQNLPTLKLYCPNPAVLCALFEPDTGFAAGLQIGVSLLLEEFKVYFLIDVLLNI